MLSSINNIINTSSREQVDQNRDSVFSRFFRLLYCRVPSNGSFNSAIIEEASFDARSPSSSQTLSQISDNNETFEEKSINPVKEQIQEAVTWIRKKQTDPIKSSFIPNTTSLDTPAQLAVALMQHNQGICIGERHHECGSKSLVIDTINACQHNGIPVQTLFLEHLLPEHQEDLNEYYDLWQQKNREDASIDPKMPEGLESYLNYLDYGFTSMHDVLNDTMYSREECKKFSFLGMVVSAIQRGVRVVALEESQESYHLNRSGLTHSKDFLGRSAILHRSAAEKITDASGKWIALVGSSHLVALEGDLAKDHYHTEVSLPGIADLVGSPSIISRDAIQVRDSFHLGKHERSEFIYDEPGFIKGSTLVPGVDFTTIHDGSKRPKEGWPVTLIRFYAKKFLNI